MSFRATESDGVREARTTGLPVVKAYFVEVAPGEYEPTIDSSLATHGLVDVTGLGDWEIAPIESLDGSVQMRRIGSETYLLY